MTVEAFLLDFAGDIYDREIRLDFLHKIRDERRFESVDALVVQMRLDIAAAASLEDPSSAPWASTRAADRARHGFSPSPAVLP